jgi:manganese/iron transport system ATP-binding protein
MESQVLHFADVAVEMGGRQALEKVNLDITSGEFVGLIGPNGAGKTTLIRAALGLVPLQRGLITILGRTAAQVRDGVGYVPQRHEFAWDYPLSVSKVVMSGRTSLMGWFRRPGRHDERAVDQALDRVGMSALRDRPVGELSGGQRQRVLMARALARHPRLLFLDEPFTGLDVTTQDVLTHLFHDLQAEGVALLMTTHDLPAASAACTRLCLLNRTVIADGPPSRMQDPAVWLKAFGVAGFEPSITAPGARA